MGLFRKKVKSETKENTNIDGIEIVDLESSNDKVVNTLEQRKEFKIAIFIGIGVLLFALLLPKITSIFTKDSIFTYTDEVNEIVNNKTVDGMLIIGKEEGSITAKKVKFYNPLKRTNNQISVTYLPDTVIKDVDGLNLYVEIYNSNKNLISRVKFTNIEKLERKVQGNYKIDMNETIYKEAEYLKVTIIKDEEFSNITDTLTCIYENIEGNAKVYYKRIYNFTNNGLLSYTVSKSVSKIDVNNVDNTIIEKYTKLFSTENDVLKKTNIDGINLTDNSIEYTVNLSTLELNNSSYKKLYEQGSIKRQIELSEENLKWMCE